MCDICACEKSDNPIFIENDERDFVLHTCNTCFTNIKLKINRLEKYHPKKIVFENFHTLIPHSTNRYHFFRKCIY
jgi:hypothetical protein